MAELFSPVPANQSPSPGASNGSSAGVSQPPPWQKDADVMALSDAFTIGWKITELKNGLQIADLLTQTIAAAPPVPAPTTPDGKPADGGKQEGPLLPASPHPTASPGVATIDVAAALRSLGDLAQLTSGWRGSFEQIATIHSVRFAASSTSGTFYQPPSGRWADELPYLYPRTPSADGADPALSPAYAAIGLTPLLADGKPALGAFTLYDVTRRALNCLAVLYARSDDGLIADIIRAYQADLLQALHEADSTSAPAETGEKERCAAVHLLTLKTMQLLDAWEGYLRENYYAGGSIPNDARERLAFEAGRTLAEFGWKIAVATVTTECIIPATGQSGQEDVQKQLFAAWSQVFTARAVIHAQHYISSLSTTFDQAYNRSTVTPRPAPSADDQSQQDPSQQQYDPALPSEACHAVKHGLDFWLRVVEWLDPQQSPAALPLTVELSRRLRAALVEQSNVWQSLLTGQQNLSTFGVESIMHRLMQKVIDEFEQDAAANLRVTSSQEVKDATRTLTPIVLFAFALLVAVALPAAVWIAIAHPRLSDLNPNGLWAVLALGPALAGVFGYRSLGAAPKGGSAPAGPSLSAAAPATGVHGLSGATVFEQLGDLTGKAGTALIDMWQAAYRQVRRDLAGLNYAVGVAYPLIECFILYNATKQAQGISNDYDFMTTVIWSSTEREDEITDVVRAALGPIGIVISSHVAAARAGYAAGAAPPPSGAPGASATAVVVDGGK